MLTLALIREVVYVKHESCDDQQSAMDKSSWQHLEVEIHNSWININNNSQWTQSTETQTDRQTDNVAYSVGHNDISALHQNKRSKTTMQHIHTSTRTQRSYTVRYNISSCNNNKTSFDTTIAESTPHNSWIHW